jgi:hypothetical protein
MKFDINGEVIVSPTMSWAISGALASITQKTGFDFESAETAFEMYLEQPTESFSVWVKNLPLGIQMGGSSSSSLETSSGDFWFASTSESPMGADFAVLEVSLVDREFLVNLQNQYFRTSGRLPQVSRVPLTPKSAFEADVQRRMEMAGHNNVKKTKNKKRRKQSSQSRKANRK